MASDNDDSALVRQIYAEALRRDPEEWNDYLDRVCADRPRVRSRVAALLDAKALNLDLDVNASAAHLRTEGSPAAANVTIGPYIIRHEIGRGGMGVVYLADDTRLARRVALKALSPSLGADLSGRERLRLEARAAAGLSHPGIATVYALEEIEGNLYLACEYVPGEPLRALLKSGPLPFEQVVDIAAQLARALAAAHTQGITHRDIKPDNVMRTPSGIVKVLDFGLARLDDGAPTRLTQTGVVLGTPAYLAPEQALGGAVDYRTDIFALGLVTYELASGANPFAANSLTAILARIIEEEPPPLSALRQDARQELDEIVARCLRKNPQERYASTQEVVADLERLQAQMQEVRRAASPRFSGGTHASTRARGPLWWWETHQLIVCVVYAAMVYPTWLVRGFVPPPFGTAIMLAVLGAAAAAATFRLHLWFVARHFPSDIQQQRSVTAQRVRLCDLAFGGLLILTALLIGTAHPEFAMLFIAVATATLVAAFVIEPATARVAFPEESGKVR